LQKRKERGKKKGEKKRKRREEKRGRREAEREVVILITTTHLARSTSKLERSS
jgi:hypothetical protein